MKITAGEAVERSNAFYAIGEHKVTEAVEFAIGTLEELIKKASEKGGKATSNVFLFTELNRREKDLARLKIKETLKLNGFKYYHNCMICETTVTWGQDDE